MPTHGGHAEKRPDGNAGKPRAALSLRRSPNPWAGVTVFAAVVTVLMAVGMATAFAVGQRGLAFVPAAVAAFGIGLVVYTNTRRTHPETLVITGDAIEYIGQADRGLALTRSTGQPIRYTPSDLRKRESHTSTVALLWQRFWTRLSHCVVLRSRRARPG